MRQFDEIPSAGHERNHKNVTQHPMRATKARVVVSFDFAMEARIKYARNATLQKGYLFALIHAESFRAKRICKRQKKKTL